MRGQCDEPITPRQRGNLNQRKVELTLADLLSCPYEAGDLSKPSIHVPFSNSLFFGVICVGYVFCSFCNAAWRSVLTRQQD